MSKQQRRVFYLALCGIVLAFMIFFVGAVNAQADWRWAPPKAQTVRIKVKCNTLACFDQAVSKHRKKLKHKLKLHNARRLREWNHWTKLYIPQCTWYGESGTSAQFAPIRYTIPNSQGSGAYGKYQMMPGTYHNRAKYHDWSPLDQEIAGHREYYANGTQPWTNCH